MARSEQETYPSARIDAAGVHRDGAVGCRIEIDRCAREAHQAADAERAIEHPHHVGAHVERRRRAFLAALLRRAEGRRIERERLGDGDLVTRSCSTLKNDGPPESTSRRRFPD